MANSSQLVPITFGTGGEWRDAQWGPCVHFADNGQIDLGVTRIETVGLNATAGETWTLVVRARCVNALESTLVARASATSANRTFMMHNNRPGSAASTPRFDVRGATTNTSWNLDDDQWHTYWVTWDGVTCRAYYDDARGNVTLTVGTAAEETAQTIMFGARTTAGPTAKMDGDLDFVALLDVALLPATIIRWHRDLYSPWRPATLPAMKMPAVTAPTLDLVYAPRYLEYSHLELWTGVESNFGLRRAIIANPQSLTERVGLDGEHTLSFSVAIDHPLVRLVDTPANDENLRIDQVVRLVLTDGSYTEHRLSERTKANRRGARTRSFVAHPIIMDLGFRGYVTRTTADGNSTNTFPALGLTMAQHIQEFIIPALLEGGQGFWQVGTMTHTNPVDVQYSKDTALSALRKIGGDLELSVTRTGSGYAINLLKQVGAGLPVFVVRSKRNLRDLGFTERDADQATRIYPSGQGDPEPTMGSAVWLTNGVLSTSPQQVRLVDPAGGAGPIKFDGQFLPAREGDPRYHLKFLTSTDIVVPIVASYANSQTVAIEYGFPLSSLGDRVQIVADGSGRQNLFVDYPAMVAKYGVRVGEFSRPDIPATDNLIPNPLGRIWPAGSPLPNGWAVPGPFPEQIPQVFRETSNRYWQHGGAAVRVVWQPGVTSGGDLSRVRLPIARIPLYAQGYLSWFVTVTTLAGRVLTWLKVNRALADSHAVPTPAFPYVTGSSWEYWVPQSSGSFGAGDVPLPVVLNSQLNISESIGIQGAWDLTTYPLYGGTVEINVAADYGGIPYTECIIEAGQLTISPEQLPLLEGNGGVKLHQAANERVEIYGPPAPTVLVDPVDLAFADGLGAFHQRLQIGGPITILDPETDVAVSTRVVGWTRDWFNRTLPSVELSNRRQDITRVLGAQRLAPRQAAKVSPPSKQGLTYTPS